MFASKVNAPTATLLVPVVLDNNAFLPTATLLLAVVLASNALPPRAVLY